MFFYKIGNKIAFSYNKYDELNEIHESEAAKERGLIFFLTALVPNSSRRSFSVSDSSLLYLKNEDLRLLVKPDEGNYNLKDWLLYKISSREIMAINTSYQNWRSVLYYIPPSKWKVNLVGLGDVGGTLLTGLRLLGGSCISEIGIYSRSAESVIRWELEANQILDAFNCNEYPLIKGISEEELFSCDMFVFCASKNVPKIGEDVGDVRLYQFEGNSEIIKKYAIMARKNNFKGIFAVVSDPVDLLCKAALIESNKNSQGIMDYGGLAPEQIRGYGLGVMNARAAYYASKNPMTASYITEGRAFGPHGQGLVIANSIENYDEELSNYLTKKTLYANLEVREAGYKPFVAPALSSGALSILNTIKGNWHYSATFMGGVYMGAKNRLTPSGTELERLNLHVTLYKKLEETFERLATI
ncbi:lactate dehydrogenase [Proteiniborus sp. MB09-C3]|uniref:lactate dehydrogenase n=1 Tax=Proteiniborus sp. MB09-C3 TaxID=3050072 RepID=UPI002556E903|nr:lactate dehydrogenase [Proteiniborus sp. MB09-C3]WIV10438.1 lactate dehydrogenase [Proteiniborus sp. MB09-C3]